MRLRIWNSYSGLNAPDPADRELAINALCTAGDAGLPYLRRAIQLTNAPRLQFGAAIALHRLGDPQGMATLLEALQWRLESSPGLSIEIEAALIAIGSPDAGDALLDLWNRQKDNRDSSHPMLASICRVWAALGDIRGLEALITRAEPLAKIFVQIAPLFGDAAVTPLQRMLNDPGPQRRTLALRVLQGIVCERSFTALIPLLRDPDPEVRASAPEALEVTGGAAAMAREVEAAVQAGFSTRQAIEKLARSGPPPPYPRLLELICRWDPRAEALSGDTEGAVQAALETLTGSFYANDVLIPPLCALLQRRPSAVLTPVIARLIGTRAPCAEPYEEQARRALWPLLASPDRETRTQSARSLARLGEALGNQFLSLLSECRPRPYIVEGLCALLREDRTGEEPPAGLVQWMTPLPGENPRDRSATGTARSAAAWTALRDPRLPSLLRDMIQNTREALEKPTTSVALQEVAADCMAALEALPRIHTVAARCAHRQVLRTFYVVGPRNNPEARVHCTLLRLAAASTLQDLYGADSFVLFLEALYAPEWEVKATAIAALGRLGDPRALPHLLPLAAPTAQESGAHRLLSPLAIQAISTIRRTNPELMTLLRASTGIGSTGGRLLRPALEPPDPTAPNTLMRPSQKPAAP